MRSTYLAVLAFALVALPVWAAHTDLMSWYPDQSMKIGNTQITPGTYELKAEEGQPQLEIMHNDSVVAAVQCQWTKLPNKAKYSEVQSNGTEVTQVQFSGRNEALQFNR
jgi:hypothetical protein